MKLEYVASALAFAVVAIVLRVDPAEIVGGMLLPVFAWLVPLPGEDDDDDGGWAEPEVAVC